MPLGSKQQSKRSSLLSGIGPPPVRNPQTDALIEGIRPLPHSGPCFRGAISPLGDGLIAGLHLFIPAFHHAVALQPGHHLVEGRRASADPVLLDRLANGASGLLAREKDPKYQKLKMGEARQLGIAGGRWLRRIAYRSARPNVRTAGLPSSSYSRPASPLSIRSRARPNATRPPPMATKNSGANAGISQSHPSRPAI